jgi:hypothetical protein
MAFSDTWNALQACLSPGVSIPNWTVHRGLLGDSFTIATVTPAAVVVETPGAKLPQTVRQVDFQTVYDQWDAYCLGAMPRSDFTPLTRYSKYAISILHWLEERSGGRLP